MTTTLSPKRELWLLLTLAGIQFTHIVDFMVMMPLGPQFTQLFNISDAKFGLLVSAYTFSAGASGLLASFYVDRFSRKKLLLTLYVLFAVASVAGVPIGLFLASQFNWHIPFFVIAGVCVLFATGAYITLPPLADHLKQHRASPLASIQEVLRDANHQKAFAFTALMMIAAFTVIPYITIYTTTNGGLTMKQVPYVYLLGGAVTLFTARLIGQLTDSVGKSKMFKITAVFGMLAMLLVTVSASFGLWGILLVTTLMFIGLNGRMIPGMAIATSAANPKLRGTFMALNSSVQSAAMGLASFVGGLVISRDAQGLVQFFWVNALIGGVATVLSVLLVSRMYLYGAAPEQTISPVAARVT